MRTPIIIVVLGMAASACSTYHPVAVHHGARYAAGTVSHKLEVPPLAVRIEAAGLVGLDGRPALQLAATVDSLGLKFNGGHAQVGITVHLHGPADTSFADTLSLAEKAFRPGYSYAKRWPLPPGRYKAKVELADLSSGKHVARRAQARIPDPEAQKHAVGAVRAEVKDSVGWRPLAGYSLAGRPDSLRFTVRVIPADSSGAPLTVRARLLGFKADQTIYHWRSYGGTYHVPPLVYQGIDYSDSTVLHADRRVIAGGGPVQIRFRWKVPPRGNYRFEVTAGEQRKGRDFAVRSPGFPSVITARERAAPLAYLIDLPSYIHLMAIDDPDSLAAAVADFWRSDMQDSSTARRVAAKYYRQVQQANRLFSNYKAGWKTARGYWYVLYGPPDDIYGCQQRSPGYKDGNRWHYDCVDCNFEGFSFCFFQPFHGSSGFPFEQSLLPGKYFHDFGVAPSQRKLWRSGEILKTGFHGHWR